MNRKDRLAENATGSQLLGDRRTTRSGSGELGVVWCGCIEVRSDDKNCSRCRNRNEGRIGHKRGRRAAVADSARESAALAVGLMLLGGRGLFARDGAFRRAHHYALVGGHVQRRQSRADERLQQQRPRRYKRDDVLMPAQQDHARHSPNFPLPLGFPKATRTFPNCNVRHESRAISIGPATTPTCQYSTAGLWCRRLKFAGIAVAHAYHL